MSNYYDDPEDFEPGDYDDETALEERTPPRGSRRTVAPPVDDYPEPPRRRTNPVRDPRAMRDRRDAPRSHTGYYPPTPDYPYAETQAQQRTRGKLRPNRRDSGFYLPWWSLLIMLVVVGGLSFGALMIVGSMGGNAAPGGSTPIIVVITSTFTIGPPASTTPIPQKATLTATRPLPTIAPTATLPAGNVAIGSTVTIVGVGGSGLNVRSGPGKQFNAKFLAYDGQKYVVKDGPQFASDEEWYQIEDVSNPNNSGWASRRFLQGN